MVIDKGIIQTAIQPGASVLIDNSKCWGTDILLGCILNVSGCVCSITNNGTQALVLASNINMAIPAGTEYTIHG